MADDHPRATLDRSAGLLLVGAIFLLAICGLIYELIAGTLSSYLLGDSVTQFSIVIGLFLTAMGLGSYLSKFFVKNLLAALIAVEVAVGLFGGMMALVCFATFSYTDFYIPVLLLWIGAVGVLVGLEIPLVVRILRQLESLRITLANVLSADYAGALAASLLFPFILLPNSGVVRSGLVMGLMNVAVAAIMLWRFAPYVASKRRRLSQWTASAAVILLAAFIASEKLVAFLEDRLYSDDIIYACDTPYQRLVLTRWREDIRLYLNGHLQFSSVDEYRYHETLVHPAMALAERRENVLILGGGDGLAAREVLKHSEVRNVDLVDIDREVTDLFTNQPILTALNRNSLSDERVHVHNADAMGFLQKTDKFYDVVILDLPDPSAPELGKLFSKAFYSLVGRHMAAGAMMSCQCTSPFRSREAFWCIIHTIAASGCGSTPDTRFDVHPYHTVVPTFGTWGFAVAGARKVTVEDVELSVPTRYLAKDMLPSLFVFPEDMAEVDTPVSTLDDPVVCRLYRVGYHKYLE